MTSFKSSDEMRRAKELEEARKAGLAPAELDEEGKEINPHIPQYMSTAPWYLNSDKPTLKHQRNWKQQMEDSSQWYDRGAKVFQATKYRKGACENCGSMSHKLADCLERPRAKGAKFTGKHIAADDKIQELQLAGWDSKRDRYNGYDTKEYAKVVERYEQVEAIRQELKGREQVEALYQQGKEAEAAAAAAAAGNGAAADGSGQGPDDAKIADDEDAAFGEVKKRVRTTAGGSTGSVRNLRIREDTAKYLLNLDANSAHYDPKSRSMREDPNPNRPANEKTFFGDNFVRNSGDYTTWQALNLHSMQAFDKGTEVHVQALPSLAEVMYQQYRSKKEAMSSSSKQEVLAKYGNSAQKAPDESLLLGQTEAYVEYDRTGRVIKGQEVKKRSRYEEDVLINNHTAVWGSWWSDGAWGYACCRSCVKNSYCTGKAGEKAIVESGAQMVKNLEAKAARAAEEAEARAKSTLSNKHLEKGDGVWGDAAPAADEELDPEKVKAALKKLEKEQREAEAAGGDERKRKFNSVADDGDGQGSVSAEEMEAFRLMKRRAEDPAAAFGAGTDGYDML
uniref:Pre-mRNA-splicing factor SLU7 n=1 Tax=Tetradesmus obliquus TaxID=3088 RepID=A0A383WHT7_TETOB|eukprot:jgi/Sobl393_1/6257/SZX77010.1